MGASHSLRDHPQTAPDHSPIILHMKQHRARGKKPFKFENYWLHKREVRQVVQQAGESVRNNADPIRNLHHKIRSTQRRLGAWAAETYKLCVHTYLRRSKWVVQQLDHVEEAKRLSEGEFRLRISLREHIFNLSRIAEEKWRQRSGARWLRLVSNFHSHLVSNAWFCVSRSRIPIPPFLFSVGAPITH